jgi:cobaltochelatase CobS
MSTFPSEPMQREDDFFIGLYERPSGAPSEWWRVSASEREQMYRIEHGGAQGRVNIDTVVDLDNLRAKLQKWHREGFVKRGDTDETALPHRADFMPRLRGFVDANAPEAVIEQGAGGALVPAVNPAYLFTDRAQDVLHDISENKRVMLIGHTGAGKTSLIEQIAARSAHGVLRSNMNGQTTVGDFVGFWTVKGGETQWVDGVLPVAMRAGHWLIIDEIDFAEPAILAVLTAVLEPNGRLLLKEKGDEIVEPHPSFRLFATANAAGAMSAYRHLYQGANLLNEAFLDRWRVYLMDYLPAADEAQVLMRIFAPRIDEALAHTLAAIAADCRAAFVREDLASAFSTRRLIDWTELMLRHGDPERAAGPAIYAKVSAEDAVLIRSIIRHHIDLDA